MKRKQVVSILLSAAMVLNGAMPAFAAESNGTTGIPKPILEFTFDGDTVSKETGTVKGVKADGTEVEATATNVEFATDELGNDIAVFALGNDGGASSIKYASDDNDPMKKLEAGKGATISAWIKTVGGDFQDTLFYYGSDSSNLGSSLHVLAQNDTKNNDGGDRPVYYRGTDGKTAIYDESNKKITDQKLSKGSNRYKEDVWQLVTYVEEADGSGKLYIDGVVDATWNKDAARGNTVRTLQGIVDDTVADVCYIGAKPGLAEDYFIGGMDSISVYGEALTAEQVKAIYDDYKDADKLNKAKEVFEKAIEDAKVIKTKGQGKYSSVSWNAFIKELDEAEKLNATTLDEYTKAYKELKRAQSGLTRTTESNYPIVEFNFSNVKQSGEEIEVTGITGDGTEVTATAWGVSFRDGVATFPTTASSIGIKYEPSAEADPMKNLKDKEGATIAMWIKPAESEYTSSYFAYGAMRQPDAEKGETEVEEGLGRSIHLMGRNGLKKDQGTVFYRENNGKTDVYGDNNKVIGNQKINQKEAAPYKVGTWQLLTYVEETNGTGSLYINGKSQGTYDIEEAQTKLFQYADDKYEPDTYYIGYLPYEAEDGDTHFVGDMDSVAVYAKAMAQGEVQNIYEVKLLEDAIETAEKYNPDNFKNDDNWTNFEKALEEAKKIDLDTATTEDVNKARTDLEKAEGDLIPATSEESVWNKALRELKEVVAKAKPSYDAGNDDGNGNKKWEDSIWNEFVVSYLIAEDDIEIAEGNETGTITADQMNKDREALEKAMAELEDPTLRAAREALQKEIDRVKATYKASENEYDEDVVYYTNETWTALMTALDAAEVAVKTENTVEGLDDARENLLDAEKKLVKTPIQNWKEAKNALADALKEWKDEYDAGKSGQITYTDATWDPFVEAYDAAAAEEVGATTENPEADATKLNNLANTLNEAGNALKVKTQADFDKEALDEAKEALADALAAAKTLHEGGQKTYTDDTWKAFDEAYNAAAKVNLETATVADVDALNKLAENLNKAREALKEKTPEQLAREALAAAVEKWKTTYEGGQKTYTDTTWKAFKDAYEKAKSPAANATAAELNGLLDKLNTAGDGLKQKTAEQLAVEATLAKWKPIHDAGGANYTEDTWGAFDKAYKDADSVINPYEPIAEPTAATFNALNTALENAGNALKTKEQAALESAELGLRVCIEKWQPTHDKGNADNYYTGDTWSSFATAFDEAKKVVNENPDPYNPYVPKEGVTKEQLEKAAADLEAAGNGLVTTAHKNMEDALAALKEAVEKWTPTYNDGQAAGDYTDASWGAFETAYEKAYAQDTNASDTNATLEDINKLISDLETAGNGLKTNAEDALEKAKADLAAAVEKVRPTIEAGQAAGDYTDDSWKTLVDAYNNANNPPADAKVEDLKNLQTTLEAAFEGLKTKEQAAKDEAQKELDEVIDKAKPIIDGGQDKGDYSDDSWNDLKEDYENATNPKEDATAEDLKNLKDELQNSLDNLETKDEEALKDLVDKTKPIIDAGKGDYTDDSWKDLEDAYNNAKNPPADATSDDLKNLQQALQDAIDALTTKTQQALEEAKKNLANAVAAAKPIIDAGQGNYTDDSWKAFVDAYNNAKNPPANATAEDLRKLQTTLEDAQKNLKQKETGSSLQDEINKIAEMYNVSPDTLAITTDMILGLKNDNDVKGSSFGLLQLRATKMTNNSAKIKWKKVKGADGYIVFGNKCGNKNSYKLLKTTTKTNYTQKKLKKGTYYKYMVLAYKEVQGTKVTLAASKVVHTVTNGGKYGVAKAVNVDFKKVNLKAGKKFKVKATEVKADKPIKLHRKVNFESSNPEVATVNKKGKIKAKKAGKCTVYAYAQNGVFKKINVTVK